MKSLFCFSIFLFTIYASLRAQSIELGLQTGLTYYEGELSPVHKKDLIAQLSNHYGLFMQINQFKWMSFRLGYTQMTLKANGMYASFHPNVNIYTPIKEMYWQAIFYPIRIHPFDGYFQISPFIGSGVIFLNYHPHGKYKEEWILLRPIGTEGQGLPKKADPYPSWAFAVPLKYGVAIQLNKRMNITLELMLRYPFTDYLDDISFTSVSPTKILEEKGIIAAFFANSLHYDNPNTAPDTFRRGTKRMDYYHSLSVGISYRFGKIDLSKGTISACWENK